MLVKIKLKIENLTEIFVVTKTKLDGFQRTPDDPVHPHRMVMLMSVFNKFIILIIDNNSF